jgi:hypothetical protein
MAGQSQGGNYRYQSRAAAWHLKIGRNQRPFPFKPKQIRMSTIQNINYLEPLLSVEELIALDKAAARHTEQSNINFKITSASDQTLRVETTQGETSSGKYASDQTLAKRTEDLFKKRLPEFKIVISTNTVQPSLASVVNVSWIERKMLEKGLRIKQIAFETGIDRESISDWVNGKRSMSQIVKAMFYFYLSK